MKKSFEVLNVKCGGCAKKLRESLEGDFGAIDVSVEEGRITLEIEENREKELAQRLNALGYPLAKEGNGLLARIKSFVACKLG